MPNSKLIKALLAISALVIVSFNFFVPLPSTFATTGTPNLSWNPVSLGYPPGLPTTATYGVSISTSCPSGGTFQGTLTVIDPSGNVATVSVVPTLCGTTNLQSIYPTDFVGPASTLRLGTYQGIWAGSTSAVGPNGKHLIFKIKSIFSVRSFTPTPEFPVGLLAILVIAAPLLLFLKKKITSGVWRNSYSWN